MYAAIRRGQTDLSTVDEVRRRIEQGFMPIVSAVPGFVAYYAVHIGNGVVLTISVFEDQAGAEESSRRSAEWVKQNPAYLLLTPIDGSAGEVIVHRASAGGLSLSSHASKTTS